jgi:Holliday junction resolvase-like predicted endonuclease
MMSAEVRKRRMDLSKAKIFSHAIKKASRNRARRLATLFLAKSVSFDQFG